LELNPGQGIAKGNNCFKTWLAVRSKHTGKSGGVRVITHVKIMKQTVYLLSIHDKSEQSTIVDKRNSREDKWHQIKNESY